MQSSNWCSLVYTDDDERALGVVSETIAMWYSRNERGIRSKRDACFRSSRSLCVSMASFPLAWRRNRCGPCDICRTLQTSFGSLMNNERVIRVHLTYSKNRKPVIPWSLGTYAFTYFHNEAVARLLACFRTISHLLFHRSSSQTQRPI